MKKHCSLTVLFIISTVLFYGCRQQSDVTILKLGHGLDMSHPVHNGMLRMAELVAEKSDGKMRIDIYPNQQLGTERETLELLQIGSLAMTKVSSSVLEGFVPSYSIFSLPFVFRDEAHRFAVLEGEIGKSLLLESQEFWLRGLCYYDAGSRSFYTKDRPIRHPKDIAGLKIRVQESPTSFRMIQAFGGSPTPISWGELYTSLQQGIVDGAENNPPSFYVSRHYEVAKYYTINEHTAVPDVLVVSTHIWKNLTDDEQRILQEAADESIEYQKKLWKEATEAALKAVAEAGVEIIYPDKELFREQVEPLLQSYRSNPRIGELLDLIGEL